jgi:transposase
MTKCTRRYQFKLYPTDDQAAIMHEQRAMMADLWNALKQRCEDVYRREGHDRRQHNRLCEIEGRATDKKPLSLTYMDLTNEITGLRHACPEWEVIPALTSHRVAKCLIDAYQAFYRRLKAGERQAGYPKWRRRKDGACIPLGTMGGSGWKFRRDPRHQQSWSLHYKSVTSVKNRSSWMHARGLLPAEAEAYRNADILWRDGDWWLSICVDLPPRRLPGRHRMTIEFDLIDGMAIVNGELEQADDLIEMRALGDDLDRLKAERDTRFPYGRRRSPADEEELTERNAEIAELSAYLARRRRNFLHVWTARLVARASDITIIAPRSIKQVTQTPRGDEREWGANVATASLVNRHVLNYAPAMAIAMLKYKSEEAGIRCDVVEDAAPKPAVGEKLVAAGKAIRKMKRAIRGDKHVYDRQRIGGP